MDEKSNRNHMTWRAPGVCTAAWGTAFPLRDGQTDRRDSHGRVPGPTVSGSGFSLAGAGRISTGDRGILAGGGRFLVAVPWLPEPEPHVDGWGGSRTHRGPPTGPRMREAGSPGRAAFTVQEACPPPRPSPTEGRRPEPCRCRRWKPKLRTWDGPAGRPAGTHKVHCPCVPVWGARGQHQGHRAAPGN